MAGIFTLACVARLGYNPVALAGCGALVCLSYRAVLAVLTRFEMLQQPKPWWTALGLGLTAGLALAASRSEGAIGSVIGFGAVTAAALLPGWGCLSRVNMSS